MGSYRQPIVLTLTLAPEVSQSSDGLYIVGGSPLINITKLHKVYGYFNVSAIFTKGNNFCDFPVCLPGQRNPSERESTLNGKNLLLQEQIHSFLSRPSLARESI